MKIEKLEIQNFCAIGTAKVELDDRGLLLIQGENTDNPSADSNGAGKSSIVDALCWCLYGVTARGIGADAVVNRTAKKDCSVIVTLDDGGVRYRIERYRKHATKKNQILVFKLGASGEVDMSKGTDKETQEVVTNVVGCSIEVFMAAVYAGQERMPDLPGMTDKILKTLIEEAAGVEELTKAYAVARDRAAKVKANVDALTSALAAAQDARSRKAAETAATKAKAEEFDAGRRDRAKAELSAVIPLNAEIKRLYGVVASGDKAAIEEELTLISEKMNELKREQAELTDLEKMVTAADRELTRLKTILLSDKQAIEAAEKSLAAVDESVGKPCGECGKPYQAHDLEATRKIRADALETLRQNVKLRAAAARTAMETLKVAQEAADKYRAGMTDPTHAANRMRALTNELNTITSAEAGIESKTKQIESIKALANTRLIEANPWMEAIEMQLKEAKRNSDEIANLEDQLKNLVEQHDLLTNVVKVFGPAGVRAHILDTVTPFLNDRTRDYLGALSDGDIHAVWSTLSKTAKGDLKEKFNIDVVSDTGADNFAGLSGGEKRKVRLATAMALQDMVASRATKPINIFIADEVDHALDEAGLERLMGVLEGKARERGTVLVISHNSLGDWIPEVITVVKKGGYSTVTGSTVAGM